jgi:hypothetical protein
LQSGALPVFSKKNARKLDAGVKFFGKRHFKAG